MSSIQCSTGHCQGFLEFYDRVTSRSARASKYYHAVSLHSLQLSGSQFWLYSQIAQLASFGNRIADLRDRAVVLRSVRSKRQINRTLHTLRHGGYIVHHGERRYSLRGRVQWSPGHRLRPMRPAVLQATTDAQTGLYARMMILMAATRLAWCRWTWRTVRNGLHCDTATAQALYAAFRIIRGRSGRARARRAVFYCSRPQWQHYRTSGGLVKCDPRPGSPHMVRMAQTAINGSDYVSPREGVYRCVAGGGLTRTAALRAISGFLGGRAATGPTAPGSGQQDHIAAVIARRAMQRRRRERLQAIHDGRSTAAQLPGRRPGMEGETDRRDSGRVVSDSQTTTPPAGSVFESLIANLPDNVRSRFEQEPAVIAQRARVRRKAGYR